MKSFDVFLNGKFFDTVCFNSRKSATFVLGYLNNEYKNLAGKFSVKPIEGVI